jgi:hypothetical protein
MEKKEQSQNLTPDENKSQNYILFIVWFIFVIFALYLSFKCNKGFDLLGFLGAFCCPVFYVPYKLTTTTCF